MSKRWNYLVVEIKPSMWGTYKPETLQEELNKHGKQGWELVNITMPTPLATGLLTFKKEA